MHKFSKFMAGGRPFDLDQDVADPLEGVTTGTTSVPPCRVHTWATRHVRRYKTGKMVQGFRASLYGQFPDSVSGPGRARTCNQRIMSPLL